ncbi:MAG: cytochrome c3 family protein, partial [Pyrinomonadaceae bacterium]
TVMKRNAGDLLALKRKYPPSRIVTFLTGIAIVCALLVLTYVSERKSFASDVVIANEPASQDFSKFPHGTAQHTRLPCLVCHVRSDNSAAPKMPGHIPCSSCHAQQFAEGNSSPICSICHTATDVKRFPALRSFNAVFDHGKHLRQTNCATCHKPSSRGVALSIPSRTSAHVTCFQCHGPQTMAGGKNIGSCSTCHQNGSLRRTPETAKGFRVNFSHSEHARKGLSCSECHTVRPGAGRGSQVTAPIASMHFAAGGVKSCAACHNDQRAFGADNFTNCRRCHEGKTFRF